MLSGAFSPVHILVVMTVALIVLGPTELPKVVRAGTRALRELRALRARLDEEVHALFDDGDDTPPSYDDAASRPTPELDEPRSDTETHPPTSP
jgi:Sec-independent protein translocase protein TatA